MDIMFYTKIVTDTHLFSSIISYIKFIKRKYNVCYYTLHYILYINKSDVVTKLVPQGNITVVHRSTNVMFHVCPEMYPFLHYGITILTGS